MYLSSDKNETEEKKIKRNINAMYFVSKCRGKSWKEIDK